MAELTDDQLRAACKAANIKVSFKFYKKIINLKIKIFFFKGVVDKNFEAVDNFHDHIRTQHGRLP